MSLRTEHKLITRSSDDFATLTSLQEMKVNPLKIDGIIYPTIGKVRDQFNLTSLQTQKLKVFILLNDNQTTFSFNEFQTFMANHQFDESQPFSIDGKKCDNLGQVLRYLQYKGRNISNSTLYSLFLHMGNNLRLHEIDMLWYHFLSLLLKQKVKFFVK